MNFGAILAGGIGTRMGGSIPKQFIELKGKPIILYTIERMLSVDDFDRLYIGIHPDYKDYLRELLSKYCILSEKIVIVDGGKERIDSVENVLNAICKESTKDNDVVVMHDGVRPFVSKEILINSINTAREFGVCVATVPAVDTMYMLDKNGFINGFPDRKTIFNGQAPDSFRVKLLKQAIDSLTEQERATITGTVQICAAKGYPIKTIQGDYKNMKITTTNDLIIAESIIESEKINESLCS